MNPFILIFLLALAALCAVFHIFLRRMEEVRSKERNIMENAAREYARKRWYVVPAAVGRRLDKQPGHKDKACRVDPCGDPGLEGAYIVEGDLLNEGEATGTPYVKHYHPESDRYREDPDAVVDERGNVYKPVKP